MTTYKEVFKKSFKLAWKPKSIWIYGLFASFLGIGGSVAKSMDLTGSRNILINLLQTLIEVNFFSLQALKNIPTVFAQSPISVTISVLIFLIVTVLTIILLILAIVSQSTLINTIYKKSIGKKVSYIEGISFGLNNFWPILGLNVITRAVGFIAFMFLVYVVAASRPSLFVPLGIIYIILVLITVVISFVIRYATCHLVINGDTFKNSLHKGKELFLSNWLITFEVALMLLIIQMVFVFLLYLLIKIDTFVLYIIFVATNLLQAAGASNFVLFLVLFTVTLITLLFLSFFTVLAWSVWTELTLELEKGNITSKIKSWLKIA